MAYAKREKLITILRRWVEIDSQVSVAKRCGVTKQHLSIVLRGAPLSKKLLAALGYEKVDGLYQKQ